MDERWLVITAYFYRLGNFYVCNIHFQIYALLGCIYLHVYVSFYFSLVIRNYTTCQQDIRVSTFGLSVTTPTGIYNSLCIYIHV